MKKIYQLLLLLTCSFGFSQNAADRDPDFNPYNLATNNYFVNDTVNHCKVQTDGKIVLLLGRSKLVRLINNQIDTGFNAGSFTGTASSPLANLVRGIELQTDGKIIVYGDFAYYNGVAASNIVRLNTNGSMDTTFIMGAGFSHTSTGTSYITDVKILSNGKILVAGYFTKYNTTDNLGKSVILNSNGILDTSYSSLVNKAFKSFGQGTNIIIFGATTHSVETICNLSRLTVTGALDLTFNSGAAGFSPITTASYKNIFLTQADGKIISAGTFDSYNGVASKNIVRINANGTRDATFVMGTGFSDGNVTSMYIQADGKIVVGGNFTLYNGQAVRKIVRLNTDGSIDTTFLGGVSSVGTINAYSGPVNAIAKHTDGTLVLGGAFRIYNNVTVNYILKINADGTKNATFNNLCKGFDGPVNSMVQQPDGKLIIGGQFYSYNGVTKDKIVRLNADGSIDNSFVLGTQVVRNTQTKPVEIKLQLDGKILVSTSYGSINGNPCSNYLIRLNADGSLDATFTVLTALASNLTDMSKTKLSLGVQTDDKIYIGGHIYRTASNSRIFNRLNANGAVDGAYSLFGLNSISIYKIEAQPDNKLLVCSNGSDSYMARLLTTGALDTSFSYTGGEYFTDFKLLPDGKILARGTTIAKLNSNGSVDTSYTYFGTSTSSITGFPAAGQPDGKILLGTTNVTTPIPAYPNALARTTISGSLDTVFNTGSGFDGYVQSILIQADGKILVGGAFRNYNGFSENCILRLKGEDFYFLNGQNKIDATNNGCDASDPVMQNLKFVATSNSNPANSFGFVSNISGDYSIGMTAGTYTFVPTFENPSYFSASPASVTVNFPSQGSTVLQNFCITPNGSHPDLEITLIPLSVARPGFAAQYKLIFKNKGNQVQSGTINLVFNDAVLNFVSANPVVASQSLNNLNWNYTALTPFQTREILFSMNVNSPSSTPPVISGFVLNYTATIASALTDEMPADNSFAFNQVVVNALDPNDKACLEGATISIDKVGGYVHYMIRFENTGTYPAKTVRVRDVIDTAKFEINSLIPLNGSHSYVTKISDANKVDFIFDNINLPIDDATNDGYVAFKIKTKPTLVSGDTFSNTANIYFDYNFPVDTGAAVTTIQSLASQGFAFDNYFDLYPNPADGILNINCRQTIALKSIEIYNMLGQLVLAVPNAKEITAVDISTFAKGNYFIKVNTELGSSVGKFIKK